MIFSSYPFILLFLPIVFCLYYLLNHYKFYDLSKIWLVLASFYFYAQGSMSFFPFFLGSVMINYAVGTTLTRMARGEGSVLQKKMLFYAGILFNVGLLGYYKYYDFFVENVNAVAGTSLLLKHIALPIGISFFTFQLIAFLVDSYRGEMKEYDIISYLLFITFFPQLIVGPIIHHAEIIPQFENKENLKMNQEKIAVGIFIFAIGCAKKMLLADPLNTNAESFYSAIKTSVPLWEAWFYTIEYSISYYFDLSGYSDMAIGLGLMFGVKLAENFNAPFRAKDFQEYWQRQHITLSRFLGAYIFKSYFKKNSKYRNYYIATMVTFLVSGIWHGAGWNFIIWGIMNGILVCIAAYRRRKKLELHYGLAVAINFFFIVFTRVIFVSHSLGDAWTVYKGMFNVGAILKAGWRETFRQFSFFIGEHQKLGVLVLGCLAICFFAPTTKQLSEKFKPTWIYLVYTATLLVVCLSKMDQVVQFLYFKF